MESMLWMWHPKRLGAAALDCCSSHWHRVRRGAVLVFRNLLKRSKVDPRRPADPPTRQPADPPTRQPADPPTRQPADPPTRQPADPPTRQPADPPTRVCLHRAPDAPRDRPMSSSSLPLQVTATVSMQAPSFVPGSVVLATVTLTAKPQRSSSSSSSSSSSFAWSENGLSPSSLSRTRPPHLSMASSMLAPFQPSATARVEYVVAELSGRWTSDRSWLSARAHAPVNPSIHLDNHTQAPQQDTSSSKSSAETYLLSSPRRRQAMLVTSNSKSTASRLAMQNPTTRDDPTLGPFTWSAALADANAVGGGGRAGHSGILFRSHPLVVCEQEQIPSGSQVSFCIEAILPDDIPPSFKGSAMRYGYALVVVVKLPDTDVPHVVRVPFRVLPVMHALHLSDPNVSSASSASEAQQQHNNNIIKRIPVPTPRDVGPRPNRFLQHEDITPLRMSARLLKSAPPDDIETALALSMNGRLTDYRANVEHNRLMNEHPLDYPGLTAPAYSSNVVHSSSSSSSMPSNPTSSTAVQQQTPTAALHYLPSSSASLDYSAGLSMPADPEQFLYSPVPSSQPPLRVYAITRGKQAVAKVYLAKRVHHLGDSVQIMFDFHGAKPCYRIGARLEMHEVVGARYAVGYQDLTIKQDGGFSGSGFRRFGSGFGLPLSSSLHTDMTMAPIAASSASDSAISEPRFSGAADVNSGSQMDDEKDGVIFRKVFGDYGEFVTAARNAEVTFSIPHDAPPSFSTGVITVRWMLHFVFVVPQGQDDEDENKDSNNNRDDRLRSKTRQFTEDDHDEDLALRENEQLLLDGLSIQDSQSNGNGTGNGRVVDENELVDEGWTGGKWKGEEPESWSHVAEKEVDTLRWTLPIVVSGQPGSPWGVRNVNRISHVCAESG